MLARQIEFSLRKLTDAEAAGIHALAESISPRLPATLTRQLHYIAAVRNRAAHEDEFVLSPEEFEHFKHCAEKIQHELQQLQLTTEKSAGKTAEPAGENAGGELNLAVEKEMFEQMAGKASRLGYFPVIGVIYLLCLFLYTVLVQGWLLLLTVVLACSVVMGIKGWQSELDRGLLYVGLGAFGVVYIILLVLCFRAPVKGVPRWLGLIPGLNGIYLPIRWLRDLQWGKFLTAAAGLVFFAGAIFLVARSWYKYALAAAAVSWLISIVSAMLWGKKREK